MADIAYLTLADVLALHAMIMERTGFTPAPLRDEGLLESTIMRPQMSAHYESSDLIRQGALLATGISQSQAFLDGNKRTAFVAFDVFLRLNGLRYAGDPIELAKQLEIITPMSEDSRAKTEQFVLWLREHVTKL